MDIQSGPHSKNSTKPDRLAIAALMTGCFLFCPVSSLILLYSIYMGARWFTDQIVIAVLIVSVEGSLLIFGSINILRGNETTKQLAKAAVKNFWVGAATASLVGFILIFISRPASLGVYWSTDLILLGLLPKVLITGIPLGGLGGAIVGNTWKQKWAASMGGIAAEIIISPVLFWLFSCKLSGGC